MSGEQLPAVNTWFKLIEIILLIFTMATGNEKGNFNVKFLKDCLTGSVVDLDPDWVGSASFSRIWIGINSKHMYFYFFHEYFNMLSKILKFMTHLPLMIREKLSKLAFL